MWEVHGAYRLRKLLDTWQVKVGYFSGQFWSKKAVHITNSSIMGIVSAATWEPVRKPHGSQWNSSLKVLGWRQGKEK